MTGREELRPLASLIKQRNRVDREIAATIGRPAQPSHIGRFVAAAIFDIRLYKSATHRGAASQFSSGPLAGRSVSIRKYSTNQWVSDGRLDALPTLVLTRARTAPTSSPAPPSRGPSNRSTCSGRPRSSSSSVHAASRSVSPPASDVTSGMTPRSTPRRTTARFGSPQRRRREAHVREQAAPPSSDAGNRQAAQDLPRHGQQLRPGQRRAWTPQRRRGTLDGGAGTDEVGGLLR